MKNIACLLLTICLLASCDRAFLKKELSTSDKFRNFDYLWNEVDKKYSFFDIKNIDWQATGQQYRSEIREDMSDEAFFNILAAMMNSLKDDHTNLISPFNISRYNIASRHTSQIHKPLLDKLFPEAMSTEAFFHDWVAGEHIGYIRYSAFTNNFSDAALDYVLDRYKDSKGIILDLRDNGGGIAANVGRILGRFTQQELLVGYDQMRNGPLHNDFTPPIPIKITPQGHFFPHKMVVLTDRGSFSATTFFALSTKAFNNITLIGDTTGGGAGLPNGGELPNGWTYRFSITRMLDTNHQNYAENGVPPDHVATFDWTRPETDAVIEAAVNFLK